MSTDASFDRRTESMTFTWPGLNDIPYSVEIFPADGVTSHQPMMRTQEGWEFIILPGLLEDAIAARTADEGDAESGNQRVKDLFTRFLDAAIE